MPLPQVEIPQGDTLQKAEERVERAFESAGFELVSFENLNTALPCSSTCHFFHVDSSGASCVIVVSNSEWDEETLLTVLNVLLELRMEPDPPGSRLGVRFYSAFPVPGVLQVLFGDSVIADFESRAALVARFGHIDPGSCLQLATAAIYLARAVFDVDTSLRDPHGEEQICEIVCECLHEDGEVGEPLNALILVGCLFGELLRSRIPNPSRWAKIRQFEPWPGLLISTSVDPKSEGAGAKSFAFNPIAHVIRLWKDGDRHLLRKASRELVERCGAGD